MNSENLRCWFLKRRRALPWRGDPTPYQVWVSEIMLQQTQAVVVIAFFERWMQQFPTIKKLAEAHLDEVLKTWEGLGYYSRARHLHAAARLIMEQYEGELPRDANELAKIKGIGPYTVGAIRSFAFKEKAAAVDGNVLRVIARHDALEFPIDEMKTQKEIRQRVQNLLPDEAPWEITEALIELGATLCNKEPKCQQCPIQNSCLAFKQGRAKELPIRKARRQTELLYRVVAVVVCDNHLLVRRDEDKKIMSHLCQFPYFEISREQKNEDNLHERVYLPLKLDLVKELSGQQHTFTRFKAYLYPFLFKAEHREKVEGFEWVSLQDVQKLPFSSGHRQVFQELLIEKEQR